MDFICSYNRLTNHGCNNHAEYIYINKLKYTTKTATEMIEKAFIQHGEDGYPINVNAYTALNGFRLLGIPIEKFETLEDLDRLKLNASTLVHGYIGPVRKALKLIGANFTELPDYPEPLKGFLGRKVWSSTMGEVRKHDDGKNVFVKPRAQKRFTGHIRGPNTSLFFITQTAGVENNEPVFCSEPVVFEAEYRNFVLRNELIGSSRYWGQITRVINYDVVLAAIQAFKNESPAAYSLDFGITSDGRTLLVECNDSFSLGCYGLESIPYAKMIEARWEEMTDGCQ